MDMKRQAGWLGQVFDGRAWRRERKDRSHPAAINPAERRRLRQQYALETSRYAFQQDWFSSNVRRFEHFLSALKDTDCQLLEIGTDEGRSAVWLIDNVATSEGSRLTCIDIADHPNRAQNIAATGAAHRVDFRQGRSGEVLPTLPRNRFDFVYIDGYHGRVEVLEDAVLSFRLAKVGAVIAFDDYLWNDRNDNQDGTPKQAVDAFLDIYRNKIAILHRGHQVWIRKTAD